jgi:hypothetical protein
MENKIKVEDLKGGMKLVGVKNVYYVTIDNLEEGIVLEEELKDCLSLLVGVGDVWEVFVGEGEMSLIDVDGNSNEGWFDMKEMIEKGVFKILS